MEVMAANVEQRQAFLYPHALEIAKKYLEKLSPYCERIEIAGSLRRKNSIVHDIEIVCIPKKLWRKTGLFEGEEVPIQSFVDEVNKLERIKGDPSGKYTKRMLPEGLTLDLFMCTPENWGYIFTIRTGPARFSKELVKIAKRKGFLMRDGVVYDFHRKPLALPEEKDFFRIIGVQWVRPEVRI